MFSSGSGYSSGGGVSPQEGKPKKKVKGPSKKDAAKKGDDMDWCFDCKDSSQPIY